METKCTTVCQGDHDIYLSVAIPSAVVVHGPEVIIPYPDGSYLFVSALILSLLEGNYQGTVGIQDCVIDDDMIEILARA